MKEREIRVTNVARIVPKEGQQLAVNGQITPRPPADLIKIRDVLGRRVPIPSSEVIAASARKATAETLINPPVLDDAGSTGEPTNGASALGEAPSQYETTAE